MTTEKTVVLTLPEEAFQRLLDGDADIIVSVTEAFRSASGKLKQKEARSLLARCLDPANGQASEPVAGVEAEKSSPAVHIQNFRR